MEVGDNDEFSPEKVMSGVPAGHPSGDPRKANAFFLLDSTEILPKTGILLERYVCICMSSVVALISPFGPFLGCFSWKVPIWPKIWIEVIC